MVWKGVEIDHAVIPRPVQRHEQLHRLHRMYRPRNQPVIAFPVAIVQVNPQNTAVARGQHRRAGGHFPGKKHMAEIERHPGIRAVHLGQRQKGGGHVGHHHMGAGFVGLVFDRHIYAGIVVCHLGNRGDAVLPLAGIIGLKTVIKAVLPHPQRHQVATHFGQRIQPAFRQINGTTAHSGIGVGKRTQPKPGVGVVTHGKPVQRHAIFHQQTAKRGGRVVVEMVGIIQVGRIKAPHPAHCGDHLGHGIALLLERVQTGGITGMIGQGHGCPEAENRSGRARSSGCK